MGFGFEFVKVTENGVSFGKSDIYLTPHEALDIQEKQLLGMSQHPEIKTIREKVESLTDLEGVDLNEKLHISEINQRIPRGGAIEAIRDRLTPPDHWDVKTPISKASSTEITNTLNRDLPEFGGLLYATPSNTRSGKNRYEIGYRDNTTPEAYEKAMKAVIKYFKTLGYKATRARSTWQTDERFKSVYVYG